MADRRVKTDDSFLLNYQSADLKVASEFLTTWLPFLSKDLCPNCTQTLSRRVRSINPELAGDSVQVNPVGRLNGSTPDYLESPETCDNHDDDCDTNSLGSWKDGANQMYDPVPEASSSELARPSPLISTPTPRLSWADMAQEDELEEEEEEEEHEASKRVIDVNASMERSTISKVLEKNMTQEDEFEDGEEEEEHEASKRVINVNASMGRLAISKAVEKPKLPRERREYIRFTNVRRKKDFICLERVKGKIVNILDGLELHTGVFSAVEQKRIVDFVYELQEMGKKGELKVRTYSAPQKWMRGKGRVTLQFGCCYNYATDKNGNPPGILQSETVDPIPHLFKVIIRRLVKWHVLPPTCVPDSCIVNIYEEGDCIPPHIDNHDFVRPFCTVSFLSECDILFGSNLKIVAAGEFSGSIAIPLPVGSVLVLNGNVADVAKHCVPAVPTKRISITFRRMDDTKRPIDFVPEPDLQGIEPLSYESDEPKRSNSSKSEHHREPVRREVNRERRGFEERSDAHLEPRRSNSHIESHYPSQVRRGPPGRRRVRVNMD